MGRGAVTTVGESVARDRSVADGGRRDRHPDRVEASRRPSTAEVPAVGSPAGWLTDGRGRLGLMVALICSAFVFGLMNWPDASSFDDLTDPLLFARTTPSGGDMGAHVWGPAYLRDHLLPQLQLTGWTPDWYAGFPAYHFYMVVPSLAIVGLNAGFPWFVALPLVAGAGYGINRAKREPWWRGPRSTGAVVAALAILGLLLFSFPYGIAFKLVSVSGLVAFPLAAWLMGRLARAPEPVPAFLSLAAFVFLFDTNFTIYGGNITSTLAGEFAFSISLGLTLVAIGVVIRGMDEDRWRVPGAVLIALVALCHLIPIFFMIPALMLAILSDGATSARAWMAAGTVALGLVPIAFADGTALAIRGLAVVAVLVVFLAAMYGDTVLARRSLWLLVVGPAAMALSAFWLLPFYLREPYFNDMGWERLNDIGPPMLTVPMKLALPVAAIGLLLAYAARERIGMIFAGTGVVFAAAVANLGEGPLWNARLLPFYYLSVYVVAAVGVGFVVRLGASLATGNLRKPSPEAMTAAVVAAAVAVFVAVAMPLRLMPFGSITDDGHYQWLAFTNRARSAVPAWAEWNYSGYERKESYAEYRQIVVEMDRIGRDEGCGRAMWEYNSDLDRYGTPMALMLLPHWTDGCIGSMEGLYFESSATTPFHFLNQSVLSESPSRAQRDLPYAEFDIDIGVDQLQLMGVRYYMAQTNEAIAAAEDHPDLTQVGEAQPFVVYEVAGSALVEGLDHAPVVVSGRTVEQVGEESANRFDVGWVGQAVTHYNDPGAFLALPAQEGPDSWLRRESLTADDGEPVDRIEISDIETGTSTVSFTVDQLGEPVLVKTSFFPNWSVEGAEGPWRAGPNLMVVVPTANEVSLSYGRTAVEWLSIVLTLIGLLALFGLRRLEHRIRPGAVAGIGVDRNSEPDTFATFAHAHDARRSETHPDDAHPADTLPVDASADGPSPIDARPAPMLPVDLPVMDGGVDVTPDGAGPVDARPDGRPRYGGGARGGGDDEGPAARVT